MSQFLPDLPASDLAPLPPKTVEDLDRLRADVTRLFSRPDLVPEVFWSNLVDYLAVNQPLIPITQITGFERFVTNRGTVFPTNPQDSQPFVYEVDVPNGVTWGLRYDSSITDSYKWVFTGGAPLTAKVLTSQTTSSSTYVDLATVGPSVTVPLAGIYELIFGCGASNDFIGATSFASPNFGATPSDNDAASLVGSTSGVYGIARGTLITVTGASQLVKIQYRVSDAASVGTFARRWLIIRPVRLSS